MLYLLLLALLIGNENRLARIIIHPYCARFLFLKSLALHLTEVDKGKAQTVGKEWTKFLHQVKRKSIASRAIPMQKTHRRIKADRFKRRAHIVHYNGVEK